MKKLVLAAIVAVMALSSVPGNSTPAGCATNPGFTGTEDGADATCTYTAGGPGKFVVATPNDWSIVVVRAGVTVIDKSGSLGLPSQGDLATIAGDSVTVTQENNCAVAPVCGQGGIVAAGGV